LKSEEFLEKYGEVKVKFSNYYKYTFTFEGSLPEGAKISVSFGGDADQIYKFNVVADQEITVNDTYPNTGYVSDENGRVIDEFYESY
jgi:hypothetical protein